MCRCYNPQYICSSRRSELATTCVTSPWHPLLTSYLRPYSVGRKVLFVFLGLFLSVGNSFFPPLAAAPKNSCKIVRWPEMSLFGAKMSLFGAILAEDCAPFARVTTFWGWRDQVATIKINHGNLTTEGTRVQQELRATLESLFRTSGRWQVAVARRAREKMFLSN